MENYSTRRRIFHLTPEFSDKKAPAEPSNPTDTKTSLNNYLQEHLFSLAEDYLAVYFNLSVCVLDYHVVHR